MNNYDSFKKIRIPIAPPGKVIKSFRDKPDQKKFSNVELDHYLKEEGYED